MTSTPILDRLKPFPAPLGASPSQRKKKRRRDIAIVLLVTVGTALWIIFMITSPYAWGVSQVLGKFIDRLWPITYSSTASALFQLIWYFCFLPLLAFSYAVIMHECGHLLAGLCVNFRLLSIRVGPLEIRPPFRVSISRDYESGPSGIVRMLPRTTPVLRLRTAVMVLGGPAANLACAILLPLFANETAIIIWIVLFSYLLGIANLVPFRGRTVDSDGRQLVMLARGGARLKRALAIRSLAGDLNREVSPRDLSREWIAMATSVLDDSPETMLAHYLSYSAAWYTFKIEETGRLLEIALEHAKYASPSMRQSLICNAGVFQARKHGRADLAREWLADLQKEKDFIEHSLHMEAAIREAEGDIPGALAKLDEAEKVTLALPGNARKRVKLNSLRRWRSELQSQSHSVSFSQWSYST